MRRLLLIPLVALMLPMSGCLLGKMEKITEETRDTVKESNVKIEETKNGQQMGLFIEIMKDHDVSPNLRDRMAKALFAKLPEDALMDYLATPGPINLPSVAEKSGNRTVILPNVSLVGAEPNIELGIVPMNEDLYKLLSAVSIKLLKNMNKKATVPGLTVEELAQLRDLTTRMIHISTAVLGGMSIDTVTRMMEGGARDFRQSETIRKQAYDLLTELAKQLSLPEDQLTRIRALADTRLGVKL